MKQTLHTGYESCYDVDFVVTYYYEPGEAASFDSPGCDSEIDIQKIQLDIDIKATGPDLSELLDEVVISMLIDKLRRSHEEKLAEAKSQQGLL